MPKPLRPILAGLIALSTSACWPALPQERSLEPQLSLPSSYPSPGEPAPAAPPGPGADLGSLDWAQVFASPQLRALVRAALANHQELKLQVQELVMAQAEASARRGELWPKLRAALGAGGDRVGLHTSRGRSDENLGLPQSMGDFSFGLVASWEIDLWGKLRQEASAAQFRYLAAVEGRRFFATQLIAELARSYYELLATDAMLEVLEGNLALQGQALRMVRLEKVAARVTELAVTRFEAEIFKNQSLRNDLLQERTQAENRINFLLGRPPQRVARRLQDLKAPLPPLVRTGLPVALLSQRPDLRQAELALQAAKLELQAARANFLPALSLDGAIGFQAFNLSHLLATPESLVGQLGGRLSAPLLNRAGIEAQYRTANARQLQAIIEYERRLLQAFTEVSNELAHLHNMSRSYELRAQQVAKLQRSVQVSALLYRAARADYVEVLFTRRELLEAQMELLERQLRVKQALVTLYQALGGGWRGSDPPGHGEQGASGTP